MLANDKIAYYSYIMGLGLPIPKTFAVFHEGDRPAPSKTLCTKASLAHFLRSESPYPFYGKPSHSLYGIGNTHCVGYLSRSVSLQMADGC